MNRVSTERRNVTCKDTTQNGLCQGARENFFFAECQDVIKII